MKKTNNILIGFVLGCIFILFIMSMIGTPVEVKVIEKEVVKECEPCPNPCDACIDEIGNARMFVKEFELLSEFE